MRKRSIDQAITEAQRFIDRAQDLYDDYFERTGQGPRDFHEYVGGKHTAAVRRASMDLTRALADMRKS